MRSTAHSLLHSIYRVASRVLKRTVFHKLFARRSTLRKESIQLMLIYDKNTHTIYIYISRKWNLLFSTWRVAVLGTSRDQSTPDALPTMYCAKPRSGWTDGHWKWISCLEIAPKTIWFKFKRCEWIHCINRVWKLPSLDPQPFLSGTRKDSELTLAPQGFSLFLPQAEVPCLQEAPWIDWSVRIEIWTSDSEFRINIRRITRITIDLMEVKEQPRRKSSLRN